MKHILSFGSNLKRGAERGRGSSSCVKEIFFKYATDPSFKVTIAYDVWRLPLLDERASVPSKLKASNRTTFCELENKVNTGAALQDISRVFSLRHGHIGNCDALYAVFGHVQGASESVDDCF